MTPLRNLGDLTQTDANSAGVALIDLSQPDEPHEYDLEEIGACAASVARALAARGFPRGTRVGIAGQNSFRYLACYLGILRAGLVAVPVNYKFPVETVGYICADAAVAALFADAVGRRCCPRGVEVIDIERSAFDNFADPGVFQSVIPESGEAALILYTSGSTGRPKGVVLSHASQWAIIRGVTDPSVQGAFTRQRGIVAAPLYHMNGLIFSEIMLFLGGTIVLLARFESAAFIRAIGRYRVNVITGVPTMLTMIAREEALIRETDVSSVRLIAIGSAPLSEATVARAKTVFPDAVVLNGYGTTEVGAGIFGAHPGGLPRPQMSIGYPAADAQVRLVDGLEADHGVLEIRSATGMSGYLNLPEATAEKMRDGWIRTGDIMRRDRDGFYYFLGRADDMFVCQGENIYPGHVERVLEQHPGVVEVCVVPVADEVRGQMPIAFVVKRVDAALEEQQVKDYVLANAPPYMYPRRVFFLDQMPLGPTNKVDRRALAVQAARNICEDLNL